MVSNENSLKKDEGSDYVIPAEFMKANMSVICIAQNSKGSSEKEEEILPLFTRFQARQSENAKWDLKVIVIIIALVIILLLFVGIYFLCARDKQAKYKDDFESDKLKGSIDQENVMSAEKAFPNTTITRSTNNFQVDHGVQPPQSDAELINEDFHTHKYRT